MYPAGTQPDPGAPGVSLATSLPQLRAWAAACEESPHGIAAVWVGQPLDPAQLPQGARHERTAMAISQPGAQARNYPLIAHLSAPLRREKKAHAKRKSKA